MNYAGNKLRWQNTSTNIRILPLKRSFEIIQTVNRIIRAMQNTGELLRTLIAAITANAKDV